MTNCRRTSTTGKDIATNCPGALLRRCGYRLTYDLLGDHANVRISIADDEVLSKEEYGSNGVLEMALVIAECRRRKYFRRVLSSWESAPSGVAGLDDDKHCKWYLPLLAMVFCIDDGPSRRCDSCCSRISPAGLRDSAGTFAQQPVCVHRTFAWCNPQQYIASPETSLTACERSWK